MKKILTNPFLNLAVRLIVGFVFLYAGFGKAADSATFAKEIGNYGILPYFSLNIFALIMPWIEIIAGLFLIFGIRLKANAFVTGALMLVFIIAILSAMARGLNFNCGCFAGKVVLIGWTKIFENTALLIGCIYLFFFPVRMYSVENLVEK